jgi:hypothetical protein
VDDEGAMTSAVRPIASLLRRVRERRHCVGFWNLFYYPHLDQWLSFAGGVLIVLANTVWIAMAVHYGSR